MWYTHGMNISRRNFLTGVGGLVAVSQLPSLADDPAVFPQRGRYERLNLAYQHVSAGATAPFSILHISDTHLTEAYPDEPDAKDKLRSKERRPRPFDTRRRTNCPRPEWRLWRPQALLSGRRGRLCECFRLPLRLAYP